MNIIRYLLKLLKILLLGAVVLLAVILLILVTPSLWRKWVVYPSMEKELSELQQLRKEVPPLTDLKTYQGHIHMHTYWSHDSEGTLSDIIPAAKKHGVDFIFLSDHPRGNSDTIPRGYQGYYDGVLIEPGSEKRGLNVWPLDSAVIDWKMDIDTLIRNLVEAGGLVIYSHTEEPHPWDNPWYQGIEIYNFHTDTKDEKLGNVILNFTINGKKYRHWAYREIFDEQVPILALWDSLNRQRRIVGFAAIDTHENQNFRARMLPDGRVEWLGPNAKVIDTVSVNFFNRRLFNPPDQSGWVFKWMIDTYDAGFNYLANYVLADTLSVASLSDHMKKGHVYSAFKDLGDAAGFQFYAASPDSSISGILGDSVRVENIATLKAISPFPGEFRLIHNGTPVEISPGSQYEYTRSGPFEKGAYRIEVHLRLKGKTIPWLYTNPMYVY